VQRHDAGFGARTDQSEYQRERAKRRRWMGGAHLCECVEAVGAGEQAKSEQQCQRAKACHDQIDVAGTHVVGQAMV